MTHADLLLLASVYAKADVLVLSHSDARSLVSAHERLLEERDALRRERDEVLAAIPDGWEVDLAERRTQERDAALQRVSSAESELVRMRETLRRQVHRHGCEGCEACDGSRATLRSLVSESEEGTTADTIPPTFPWPVTTYHDDDGTFSLYPGNGLRAAASRMTEAQALALTDEIRRLVWRAVHPAPRTAIPTNDKEKTR